MKNKFSGQQFIVMTLSTILSTQVFSYNEINIKPLSLPDINMPEINAPTVTDDPTVLDEVIKLPPSKKLVTIESKSNTNMGLVCQDKVEVSYFVADENGYKNKYKALVQVQANVDTSKLENKQIKLIISGWYSKDENLKRWQYYLVKPPVSQGFVLAKGTEFIDLTSRWYLCKES